MRIRNWAFDRHCLPVKRFKTPLVAVGNLSMGGTGKSPMIEWLLSIYGPHSCAVVSRGYGRKSKGLLPVPPEGEVGQYGDEPMQIAQKYPESQVVVAEERAQGIAWLEERTAASMIFLDDAFQHRYVQADCYLLLSTYQKPFYQDRVLPEGRLREGRSGAQRASAIIITKCPASLSKDEAKGIAKAVKKYSQAPVFFSSICYQPCSNAAGNTLASGPVLVLAGIAQPAPFLASLEQRYEVQQFYRFRDHQHYNQKNLAPVWQAMRQKNLSLICTEKDWVKLASLVPADLKQQVYHPKMKIHLLFDEAQALRKLIDKAMKSKGKL